MKDLTEIRQVIKDYEELCNSGRAQSIEAKYLFSQMRIIFKELDIEFCAHNASFLGCKIYDKYFNKKLNRLISTGEYAKLSSDEIWNFENLNELNFKR